MPLAFFGTADFSLPPLQALLEAAYDVALVVTKPDAPAGRGRTRQAPAVKTLAAEAKIPVVQPASKQELTEAMTRYPSLTAGVVAAYGMLLPPAVLAHFSQGLTNVHASLLPRWRGASPVEAAILHGDAKTGISLMQMVSAMDAGPIYTQHTLELDGTETRPQLTHVLAELGADALRTDLEGILEGSQTPWEQEEAHITYASPIRKSDGEIDWFQPAEAIERQVRAYLGWPGSFTNIHGTRVTIESVRPIEASGPPGTFEALEGSLIAYTAENGLYIDRLRPAGGQTMAGEAFVRGYMRS